MRKWTAGMGVLALALTLAEGVQAQIRIGPTGALHDQYDLGIGATLLGTVPVLGDRAGFLGDFLVFFWDDGGMDDLEVNASLTYDLPVTDLGIHPFAIAGLNFARVSTSSGVSGEAGGVEVGLSLGAAMGFDLGSLRPTVGGRLTLGGSEGFVLFLTVPLELGGT